ncbi:fumarylacetoacetate hydrolase family protein [Streptosporangium sp. NPDC051022]|uniref:fumarylacetoacetate hydrolase family protein n=1 Tax=Streptosporangium sp. NPDC051022 TaxID=3155752 RepID=UPI0034247388
MIPFALATCRTGQGGHRTLVHVDGVYHDLAAALGEDLPPLGAQGLLPDWDRWLDRIGLAVERGLDAPVELDPLTLTAPVPEPRQVLCAASNYAKHVADFAGRRDIDTFSGIDRSRMMPYLFAKGPDSPRGPYGEIPYPSATRRFDYEVELGVVLREGGSRVPAARAGALVAGYLLFNDLTLRDLQQRTDWAFFKTDWYAGKAWDGSAPMGPLLVPARFVPDYREIPLELRVNGQVRQAALAGDMVFSVEEQISYASGIATLRAGDVLATGTPDGVAMKTGQWLQVGDVIEADGGVLGTHRLVVTEPVDDGFALTPPDA